MRDLWRNPHLRDLFFRPLSARKLEELFKLVEEDQDAVLEMFETFGWFSKRLEYWNDIEDVIYKETVENLIKIFCLTRKADDGN